MKQAQADMQAVIDRDPACDKYLQILLFFKGFQAIQAHRVAAALWRQDRKPLALLLQLRFRMPASASVCVRVLPYLIA